MVSRFSTSLDWGGRRLAMSPDGTVVVAAAYERHGITAHVARTGAVVWQRQDIKGTRSIRISADGKRVFVRSSRLTVMDLQTGQEIGRLHGVEQGWESPDGDYLLSAMRDYRIRRGTGEPVAPVPRLTFALLDAAFSPSGVALTESGGPVRFISLPDGAEQWRATPTPGCHVLRLVYESFLDAFLALEWPYEHGGEARVLVLDPLTGGVKHTWSGV
ncbi:MAG TPA: WD40 repeat domain-containing protein, partial [Tepidiformaceae bacterium]|nr:WD40 repeat domain-containing protein [Tepidiformaceae bacterium]